MYASTVLFQKGTEDIRSEAGADASSYFKQLAYKGYNTLT